MIKMYKKCMLLLTDYSIEYIRQECAVNIIRAKTILAECLTGLIHGVEVAKEIKSLAETHLTTKDLKSLIDSRIASKELRDTNGYIPSILTSTGITSSNNKARQFITDGAITINGIKITNPESYITPDELIGDFIVVHFAKRLYKVKLTFI